LRIIAFSGLGADHRVFNYLDLSIPIEVVEWKKGFANLSIPEYGKLLSKHLNLDEQVILLGVSFDTDKDFAKWATINLARWNGVKNNVPVSRINGTNDRVIPCPRSNRLIKIEGGHHFMIVDKAEALSTIINSQLANFIKEKH